LNLKLVDGGSGDDDGEQNGTIEDPSGLGVAASNSASTDISSSNGGGGSGGCFIDTAVNNSNWKLHLSGLRMLGHYIFCGLFGLLFINIEDPGTLLVFKFFFKR
jgi:hypothetical protein